MDFILGWIAGMASLSVLLWITSTKASKWHTGQDDPKYNFVPPTAPHVIDVRAGSLLPPSGGNRDVEATRRGLEAVRKTAASKREGVLQVDKFEDIPDACICEWQAEEVLCEPEPISWVHCRLDPQCPVHNDPEDYYWTHKRDL